MAQWRVKDISLMTGVSVRMLHHYDKIGLLRPSMRSSNGYRWYSEQDLAQLQQIIALKFFGFSLTQIKTMLQRKPKMYDHLQAQQQMLADQAEHLRYVQDALATILKQSKASAESLDWNNLISLIERYCMIDKLKDTWAAKLTGDQQARYLELKKAFPKEITAWEKSVTEINEKQVGDPEGPDGEKAVTIFLNSLRAIQKFEETKAPKKMTKEAADELLKNIEKQKAQGIPLNSEANIWFARALIAHRLRQWSQLHQDITKNVSSDPTGKAGEKLAQQWRNLITENCMGDKDLCFGLTLIMDAARDKIELQEQTRNELVKKMAPDLKLFKDPMALDWISKALKKHQ